MLVCVCVCELIYESDNKFVRMFLFFYALHSMFISCEISSNLNSKLLAVKLEFHISDF